METLRFTEGFGETFDLAELELVLDCVMVETEPTEVVPTLPSEDILFGLGNKSSRTVPAIDKPR